MSDTPEAEIDRVSTEECPTCGTVHTAGSLRPDGNGGLACPECYVRAPYCGHCERFWTGDDRDAATGSCPACGTPTSVLSGTVTP